LSATIAAAAPLATPQWSLNKEISNLTKTDIEEELKAVNKPRIEQNSMTGNQDDGVETIGSAYS
jgi:hypothetical protein